MRTNHFTRFLCAFIALVMMTVSFCGAVASDNRYYDEVERTLNSLYDNDTYCASAEQQIVNGVYRAAEISGSIAYHLDYTGSMYSQIAAYLDDMNAQDAYCTDANSQILNGLYTLVNLLSIINFEYDTLNEYYDATAATNEQLDYFVYDDAACTSVEARIANAALYSAYLTEILANECSISGDIPPYYIKDLGESLYAAYATSYTAEEQAVHSFYYAVELMNCVNKSIDTNAYYAATTESIYQYMYECDPYCTTAPQQEVNGIYRFVEMLAVMAYLL